MMDRRRIIADALKSKKLQSWYWIFVENPWNRRALIAIGKILNLYSQTGI
jgi:hypothetical protein